MLFTFSSFAQETVKKDGEIPKTELKSELVSKSKNLDEIKNQIKTFKNKRGFEVDYDRFDDSTLVGYSGFELLGFGESVGKILMAGNKSEEAPSLEMRLYFGFDSNKLNKNIEKFILAFVSSDTEWRFSKNRELFAIADDERFKFGEGDLTSTDVKFGIGRGVAIREATAFIISREQLSKLAEAKSLEIRIDKREQVLKDKHKQMFKDILALATLSEETKTEK